MTISFKKVKNLLKKGYSNEKTIRNLDYSLSGKRVKVFYNRKNNQAVVVHRGTHSLTDWVKTDIPLLFGYENGNRFKHAEKIQKKAEEKYGAKNITTIGHSLGGRIAEKVGKRSKEVITYNKAATPTSIKETTPHNQIDIKTTLDPISYLSNYQKRKNNRILVNSKTLDLIKEHSLSSFPEL